MFPSKPDKSRSFSRKSWSFREPFSFGKLTPIKVDPAIRRIGLISERTTAHDEENETTLA
ncbi:MAG: hypothetical protein MI923_10270 [Phycisphaerales bacterium]|nr:hypothetical protein [Phycisphaerales bacterium]